MDKNLILELRNKTGVGINDCKKALEETDGNIEIAECYLRLLSQPVARYRMINGEKRRWEKADYLNEARREADKAISPVE